MSFPEEFIALQRNSISELLKKASIKHIYEKLYPDAIELYQEVLDKVAYNPIYDLSPRDIAIIKYALCSCYLNKKSDYDKAYEIIHSICDFGNVFPALYYIHAKLLFTECNYQKALEVIEAGVNMVQNLQEPIQAKWPGTDIPILENNIDLLHLKFEALQQNCEKALTTATPFDIPNENNKYEKENVNLIHYNKSDDIVTVTAIKDTEPMDAPLINLETYSQSSNSSNLNLKAPEFVPTATTKTQTIKSKENPGRSEDDPLMMDLDTTTVLNEEFQLKIVLLLQDIKNRIKNGFSNISQKQMDLLFSSEDRINFLQKKFVDEIIKEKNNSEEEKLKIAKLEAVLENTKELLSKTMAEKEMQIRENILLRNCLEKQWLAMYDFVKETLHEMQSKCSYMKDKMNHVSPFITSCSVPNREEFHCNIQAWSNYEMQIENYWAVLDKYFTTVSRSIDENKFENLVFPGNFPFAEPRCILTEAFLHLLHSYNSLHHQKNTSQRYLQQPAPPAVQYRYFNPSYQAFSYPLHPPAIQGTPVYFSKSTTSPVPLQFNSVPPASNGNIGRDFVRSSAQQQYPEPVCDPAKQNSKASKTNLTKLTPQLQANHPPALGGNIGGDSVRNKTVSQAEFHLEPVYDLVNQTNKACKASPTKLTTQFEPSSSSPVQGSALDDPVRNQTAFKAEFHSEPVYNPVNQDDATQLMPQLQPNSPTSDLSGGTTSDFTKKPAPPQSELHSGMLYDSEDQSNNAFKNDFTEFVSQFQRNSTTPTLSNAADRGSTRNPVAPQSEFHPEFVYESWKQSPRRKYYGNHENDNKQGDCAIRGDLKLQELVADPETPEDLLALSNENLESHQFQENTAIFSNSDIKNSSHNMNESIDNSFRDDHLFNNSTESFIHGISEQDKSIELVSIENRPQNIQIPFNGTIPTLSKEQQSLSLSHERLDRLTSPSISRKEVPRFYDPTLSVEEQIEMLSDSVKAAGGNNFLRLFIYLWQNLPNIEEKHLLKAIQAVKRSVGKLSGMRKESILISVKGIMEVGMTNESSLTVDPAEVCTICYEEFSTGKTLQLQCNHTFHSSCVSKWLLHNNVCPICRFFIVFTDEN